MKKATDILKNMDPGLRDLFPEMPSVDSSLDLTEIRMVLDGLFEVAGADVLKNDRVITEERWIPGPQGSPDIRVKAYYPAGRRVKSLPAILYIHAGGFFFGSSDITDPTCEHYVDAIGCVVVSVDHRLAPEDPYPAAPEDCYAALSWMYDSAAGLGIDKNRIALCGTSSGGCLAAAVALMARDRRKAKASFQALVYPALDHRHITPSSQAVSDPRVWNRELALKAWKAYLGPRYEHDAPPYASPAMARDLSGLPPAYIAVCEIDLLRDEAIEYARKLYDAGVPTELHVFPGTFHSFDVCFPGTEISIRFNNEIVRALKRAFAK
jgi:acetyl esterase/lipase